VPCSNDSWTDSASLDKVCSLTEQNEGRTYNIGLGCQNGGQTGTRVSTFCFSIWLYIQLDVINLAMCRSSIY
jgi:hypothetical protein